MTYDYLSSIYPTDKFRNGAFVIFDDHYQRKRVVVPCANVEGARAYLRSWRASFDKSVNATPAFIIRVKINGPYIQALQSAIRDRVLSKRPAEGFERACEDADAIVARRRAQARLDTD